jgi:hypothetical protein
MTDVEERELNMAHALRRGPGWWMDPEGNWNPPELWPESTPPLPGWVRDADGRWHASDDPPPVALTVVPQLDAEPSAPADDTSETEAKPTVSATAPPAAPVRPPRTAASLSYAAYTKLEPTEGATSAGVTLKRALFAALGAAITAAMIGTGVTVLLGLF